MKSRKFYFIDLPSWLIILMPILLISGPFLSDLALSIVSILFIINSIQKKLIKFYDNIFFKIFMMFFITLLISSLLSENIILSLKSSFFYFRFGIFSLSFWYLLEQNIKILKFLFFSILFCFTALIVDGYTQYILGENLFGVKLYKHYRVSSFFGDELILGSFLSRLFPILFGLFVYIDKKKVSKKLLFIITLIFILTEGLIFLSGERLAFFYMTLSAVFIIIMIKNYKIYRLVTYFLSITFIIILLFLFPQSKERFIDQTINDFTKGDNKKIHIFSKPHNDMYKTGFSMFLDNKFFGVGPRQFRNRCKEYPVSEYSCDTHPHNTYIELLSETGLFGFLFIISLFVLICYASIKHLIYKFLNPNKSYFNDFEICLVSALVISLWPFAPSGSFFNNWMSIVYFFPIGILLWQFELKKNLNEVIKASKTQ